MIMQSKILGGAPKDPNPTKSKSIPKMPSPEQDTK
jgi:hypothetical protein